MQVGCCVGSTLSVRRRRHIPSVIKQKDVLIDLRALQHIASAQLFLE
jgi:hypothetical protein